MSPGKRKKTRWKGFDGQHTCMFSTQIAVIALTLVGVTPGAFNDWSDCKSASSSSIAAILMLNLSDQTDRRQRNPGGRVWGECSCCEWIRTAKHAHCTRHCRLRVPVGQSRLYEECETNKQLIEQGANSNWLKISGRRALWLSRVQVGVLAVCNYASMRQRSESRCCAVFHTRLRNIATTSRVTESSKRCSRGRWSMSSALAYLEAMRGMRLPCRV